MEIDANMVALATVFVLGGELRLAVHRIGKRLDLLSVTKQDKPGFRDGKALKAAGAALAVLGLLSVGAVVAVVAGEPTLVDSLRDGASAGSVFGPKGAAIGAAAGVVSWFVWRRWRRKKNGKASGGE